MSYLGKYSMATEEACESPRKLTYDKLYNRVKAIIMKDTCMKFYNEIDWLYLDTFLVLVRVRAATGKGENEQPPWWGTRQYDVMPHGIH